MQLRGGCDEIADTRGTRNRRRKWVRQALPASAEARRYLKFISILIDSLMHE